MSSPQASSKYSTAPSSNNNTKPTTPRQTSPEVEQNFQARIVHLKSSSAKKRLVIRNPNDEMFRRWLKSLSISVPTLDLTDLSNELS